MREHVPEVAHSTNTTRPQRRVESAWLFRHVICNNLSAVTSSCVVVFLVVSMARADGQTLLPTTTFSSSKTAMCVARTCVQCACSTKRQTKSEYIYSEYPGENFHNKLHCGRSVRMSLLLVTRMRRIRVMMVVGCLYVLWLDDNPGRLAFIVGHLWRAFHFSVSFWVRFSRLLAGFFCRITVCCSVFFFSSFSGVVVV